MRILRTFLFVCLALFIAGSPAMASGHSNAPVLTMRGLFVPSLTHEQIAAMRDANSYNAIMAVARDVAANPAYADNPALADLREYIAFAEQERTYSLWGLVPFSYSDDTNPFHRPTHAALATALQALTYLNTEFRYVPEVGTLFTTVHDATQGKLGACINSADTFNTMVKVTPDFTLPPSSTTIALYTVAAALLALALFFTLMRPLPRRGYRTRRA